MSGASNPVITAKNAWGEDIPDWISCLARECKATTQSYVAKKIKYSASAVNQVLNNRYKADLTAIEDCVRGVFMDGTILCPALGTMPTNDCQSWRKKAMAFSATNSQRVQMFRACNRCPLNQKEK